MAAKCSGEEDPAVCPACDDLVSELRALWCGHSLCEVCLTRYREQKDALDCPFCWSKYTGEPRPNLAMKEQTLQTLNLELLCNRHLMQFNRYCTDDEQLVCGSCLMDREHSGHDFWAIGKAASQRKSILRAALKTLWAKLKGHKEARALFEETAQHIKIQAQQTERQIKAEFEKLHRFLREEEEARLAALRREKEQKSQMMKKRIETIMTEMSSALDTIRTIKDQLECDNVMFLHSYKTTVKRTWSSLQDAHHPSGVLSSLVTQLTHLVGSTFSKPGQIHVDTVRRISSTPQEPKLTEGALIDVAKHLGNLKYKVWEKMAASVQYTPVTLDPNTAARCLSLSEDLTSVRYTAERQSLPDNLERFAVGAEVLGSEGFNSGQHQWEVIVGDNHNWAVGMARESVKRKEKTTLSAEEGILALRFCGGEYTAEKAPLPVPKKPQRIRVQLNWNWGEVNFSDPAHNHHIGTIAFKGSEKLFPYFYSVCKDHPLQIAPEQLNITVEAPKQGMLSFLSGVLKY